MKKFKVLCILLAMLFAGWVAWHIFWFVLKLLVALGALAFIAIVVWIVYMCNRKPQKKV